jgi:metallo-beta-lactamase class B
MTALTEDQIAAAQAARPDPHVFMEPFEIGEGLFYVGSSFYAVYLLVSDEGHIVLDAGDAVVGRMAVENIRRLGYDPADIRMLLITHPHFDHAGGLAEIRRAAAKDAKFYCSEKDGRDMVDGGRSDFFLKDHPRFYFEPLAPDIVLEDGDQVSLGPWTLTMHITAGHTPGGMTWTFPLTVDGTPHHAMAPTSWALLPGFKVGREESYPGQTEDYERAFARWKSLSEICDVFVASSNQFFDFRTKKAAYDAGKADAFVDPEGIRDFYVKAETKYRAELARQNP